MLSNQNHKRILVVSLCCLLPLAGCGGAGTNATSSTVSTAVNAISAPSQPSNSGRMQVVIDWSSNGKGEATSRYIPAYAKSLFFEFYPVGNPGKRYSFGANRPTDGSTTQTVSYPAFLPIGNYQIAGVARTQSAGQGATVASATAQFVVALNQTANLSLTLASTIKQINILKQPLITKTGVALPLPISATDPDGKVILLPANALKFSLVAGANIGGVDANGNFTGTADGTARVRVAEPGAGVSAETDIRVANGAFFQILGQPLTVKSGSASGTTLQLQAATVAPGGTPTPFPPGSLTWSVVSGNNLVTLTPTGLLTGVGTSSGMARVRVTQPDSGLTAEADVTVKDYGTGVNVGVQ